MYDSYVDGICCFYGQGSYTVTANGTVVASGGEFYYLESTNFCLPQGNSNQFNSTVELTMAVSPNPASDFLNISISKEVESIRIYGVKGNLAKEIQPQEIRSRISIQEFSAGVYIITAQKGNEVVREKIVKIN